MKNMMILSALCLGIVLAGCGKKAAPQAETAQAAAAAPSAAEDFIPAQSAYGTVTQCPVMGNTFKVGKDTKAVKYNNKVYYMCCPACVAGFKSDPAKYAK